MSHNNGWRRVLFVCVGGVGGGGGGGGGWGGVDAVTTRYLYLVPFQNTRESPSPTSSGRK